MTSRRKRKWFDNPTCGANSQSAATGFRSSRTKVIFVRRFALFFALTGNSLGTRRVRFGTSVWRAREAVSSLFSIRGLRLSMLPSSTESVIELDQGKPLVELGLSKVELGSEIVGFTGEHLQVTCASVLIQDFRKPVRICCGRG